MKKITFFLTLLVTVIFANVSYAQHSFASIPGPTLVTSGTPVTLNVNDAGNSAAVPASSTGTYSTFSVSVDWTDDNNAWSNEADLTVTTTAGSVLIDPATTGGASSGNATTMTFDGTFTLPYDPAVDGTLDIVLNQSYGGSSANWSNIVVTIYESPSCFDPTNVLVNNITTNTIDLEWTDASGGTQFDFYYVIQPAGTGTGGALVENYYDLSSGVPFTVTCTDINDCANTLLTPNTDYEVYVRADCSGTWVGPITFSTSCNPYTIPYFEGFESGYTHNVTVDGCFSQESITGGQFWTANNTFTDYNRTPRTGNWNAFLRYGNEDWLFIPIDLVGGTSYRVQLYARQDGATPANSNMTISYGTTNTAAGMTDVIVPATGIINGTYQQIYGDFTPASSGTYYVGIKGFINFSPWYISLDDISIDLSPSCLDPNMFMSANITTNSVDLSWNDTSGGTQLDYEYVIQAQGTGMPAGSGVAISATSVTGITSDINTNPLTPNTAYEAWVRADCGGGSYSTWVGPIYFSTNIEVICGTPVNTVYCYDDNDSTTWTFTSNDGSPLRITFNAGAIESCCDDILIYDGIDNSGTLLYQGNNGGDLSGLTFDSASDSIFIEIDSDGSVSCVDSGLSPQWDFTVVCATCVNPTVNYTVVPDCGNGQFSIDVDLTDLGTATSVSISDGTTTLTNISTIGIQSFGPYADASSVSIIITNEQDGSCLLNSGALSYTCPPVNDDLCNAIPLTVGAPATGGDFHLVGASIEANEPTGACWFDGIVENSVWFSFVAPSTDVEVTTDFAGGTLEDGDTQISVYDATGVTCSDLSTLGTDLGCDEDSGDVNTNYGSYVALSGLTAGTTYYIQVDSYDGAALGTFGIQVNDLLSSDDFSANEFVAYPNPVKDVLTLEYSSDITSVRVLNMLGQEVLTRTVNATSTQVDMSKLAAGTYLVNVVSENIQKTIKVVKQ